MEQGEWENRGPQGHSAAPSGSQFVFTAITNTPPLTLACQGFARGAQEIVGCFFSLYE